MYILLFWKYIVYSLYVLFCVYNNCFVFNGKEMCVYFKDEYLL